MVNKIEEEQDDDYQSNQRKDEEMEWVEHNDAKELINITSITKPTIAKSMCNNVVQNQPRYYVDMSIVFIITNFKFVFSTKKLVENLEPFSTNVGVECKILETKESLAGNNLLSLPCFLIRKIGGKEPLVNYLQSHVVTSKAYLIIM
jgi:hypothetical protein